LFNADPKVLALIAKQIERVLIADPSKVTVGLLTDLVKELGAKRRLYAPTLSRALQMAADFEPNLIFVELSAPNLDGVVFTETLRRSSLRARKAPIIMVSAAPREESIKAARDAGAHEFLSKPFTAGAVFKRVEAVTVKPRAWIQSPSYVGPDRRRFDSGAFDGQRKRRADKGLVVVI
jgi:DNA-binding response OmpR family regulator